MVVFQCGKFTIGLAQQVYWIPRNEVIPTNLAFPIFESFNRYFNTITTPFHVDVSKKIPFSPVDITDIITPNTESIYINYPSNSSGSEASQTPLEEKAQLNLECCQKDVRIY